MGKKQQVLDSAKVDDNLKFLNKHFKGVLKKLEKM